jgi:DNA-binding LacI/PurR family transcriptional regulator
LLAVPYPHLATFDIHARSIGELAARQLGEQFSERRAGLVRDQRIARQIVVRPTLVPGESVCDVTK